MFAPKHLCHCIPKRAFTFIAYPSGHLHHCIPTRLHLHHDIPTRVHLHHVIPTKGTFASWHPYKKHLHHDIPIRRHLHHKIFLHLHLCKETFASRLNMCAGTIMDKLCICTLAWDICIMKFTSLKGDMCIIWTFHICIIVKSICIRNKKKSRLASHFACIHRKVDIWVSGSKSVNSMLRHNGCILHW